MYKQSSGRNNRSKGFKIKHVIQLCVLVAICIWLIYQVKHSHDKKREFEEKNIKTTSSLSNGAGDEVIKFGRKDVQDRFEKTTLVTDQKVDEAEDEEAEGGGGGGGGDGQEDNKNEEDEQEEDIKHEEKEDEGRGGGDDEIDENDQHKYDMELEHEENLIDEKDAAEGKDKEEEEVDEEEERSERENLEEGERLERENSEEVERSERENSEEGERDRENSGEGQRERDEEDHEAREEHYKADDASSAVAHETESESLEKLNDHSGTEDESSNNAEKLNEQNSTQGNQTVGNNDIHQNVFTANSTMKVEERSSGLEEGNVPIEIGIEENSGTLLNQIQEDDGKNLEQKPAFYTNPTSSDLKTVNNFTTQLEEEQKTQMTSQNIVHESPSEVNTTTGAELEHSEAGETNKSVLELGKEDPNADTLLTDPIDSLDSSSSHLQEEESSSADAKMDGNSNDQDATATM